MKAEKKTMVTTKNVEESKKMAVEKKVADDAAKKLNTTVEASAPAVDKKEPVVKEAKPAAVDVSEKKSTAKKSVTTKKTATKLTEEAFVEFAGEQINIPDVIESAKAHYKALYENEKGALKSITVYIKPEEKVAYYVANGVGCDEYKVGI